MFRAIFGVFLLAAPLAAEAAVIEATFTGHLFTGLDGLALFGAPAPIPAGLPVVTTFRYDTSLGGAPASPIYLDGREGGQMLGVASPILFSSITIGQKTFLGQNDGYAVLGIVDDPALGQGMVIGGTNGYPGGPQVGSFSTISAQFYGQGLSVPATIATPFSMTGLMGLNVQGATSRATGYFQFRTCPAAHQCGYTFGSYYVEDFSSRILPAAVPVPATGGILAGGLGLLGLMRHRWKPRRH